VTGGGGSVAGTAVVVEVAVVGAAHADIATRAAARRKRIEVIMSDCRQLASRLVSTRMTLRSPDGELVVRDVVDGRWANPAGSVDDSIGEALWALPGLVDAHAHLAGESLPSAGGMPGNAGYAREQAAQAMSNGIMLIYDKGWCDETVLDLIDTMPLRSRPDIEAAGEMLAVEGGYYPGFARELSPGDVASAVRNQAVGRATWVKLIGDWPRPGEGPRANFDSDELAVAVSEAEAEGARVAIHTMARDVPSMAVRAGVHSIEHGLFLSGDDLDALAGRHGIWVPTIRRVEETASSLRSGSSGQDLLLEGLGNVREMLPKAFEAGVTVLTGTDLAGPSSDVALEALKLAEYGASATQALASVTRREERAFDVGAPADAVLFPENPLENLEVLRHPVLVLRHGRVL
jgi:hypothetical protein